MSSPKKSKPTSAKGGRGNSLRIIGGEWRGRKLSFPDIPGLRPTGDRIRETLFNWLAPVVPGARCLDLYSGSGALGLEALSRGAEAVVMLDRDRQVINQLKQHIATLGSRRAQVLEADALHWLQQTHSAPTAPFDIVFIDPPFQQDLWQKTVAQLESSGWLAENAAIYVEAERNCAFAVPENWQLHREKQSGQVSYRLYYTSKSTSKRTSSGQDSEAC